MKSSRIVHGASLIAVIAAGMTSYFAIPVLWKDTLTSFSALGGFATFYGVAFAAVETWRARAASEMAEQSARSARENVQKLFGLKGISECQQCIRGALQDLDNSGWASTSLLSRIIELYTVEFYVYYQDADSRHRKLIASLRSHASSPQEQLGTRSLIKLKAILIEMLTELSAEESNKISEPCQ